MLGYETISSEKSVYYARRAKAISDLLQKQKRILFGVVIGLAILRLMAEGKTTSAIAEEIFLSPETVKWSRKRLFAKFNVSNAPELVRKATEAHLI